MNDTRDDGADQPSPQPDESRSAESQPAETASGGSRLWTRRRALGLIGAGGLAGAGYLLFQNADDDGTRTQPSGASANREVRSTRETPASTTSSTEAEDVSGLARWSDPETWGGEVPGAGNVAVIERPILLDVDAEVGGARITPEGQLVFDPAASRSLRSTGNVEVEGALRMKPADARKVHRLTFAGIDERAIVGGHAHHAVPTDVGLWALGAGVIDVAGTAKTAWTRATGALEAGARSFEVEDATGWRAGDEIVVTPTEPTTVEEFAHHHDRRTIASVDGTTITLERALEHPHPEVAVRDGVSWAAEVLNLTRNVVIEGTEDGRAHIMILSSRPQSVAHAALRHMGPQEPNPESEDREPMGIESRYALHFHMVEEGSRGSTVQGVVALDGGNHAFVSHLANGITYTDCIAHNMVEDPFWWDLGPEEDAAGTPANDIVYERCVAHFIHHGRDPYSLAGFMIGTGSGNVARGCVAAGVMGASESASAFHWPAQSIDEHNTWVFEDNIAHNSANSAIYFWQNNVPRTIVDRFTAYHCGGGIFAGAYSNLASYRDTTIYACATSGLVVNAVPGDEISPGETITYEGLYVDQAGLTDYAVDITEHIADTSLETVMSGCTFAGGSEAQVAIPGGSEYHQLYRLENCRFEGNAFWLGDDVPPHTEVRVSDEQHGSIVLRRADQSGEVNSDWNAAVSQA